MRLKLVFLGLVLFQFFCSHAEANFLEEIERVHKIKKLIHQAFHKVGHEPNSTILAAVFPEAAQLLSKKVQKLERCYNSTFKGQKISIFEVPLGVVVFKYLLLYSHIRKESSDTWVKGLVHKVHTLLETIKQMAKTIIECVRNEDPDFEPTRIGLNRFAAVSSEEFRDMYPPLPKIDPMGRARGAKLQNEITDEFGNFDYSDIADSAVPVAYDYRYQGVVSKIKDQAFGQTCYIFSAIAAIESSYMLKHSRRGVSFSEQDALNCLPPLGYNNKPVKGGTVETVMRLAKEHGVIRESQGEKYFVPPGCFSAKCPPPFVHTYMCKKLRKYQIATRVKGFAKIIDFNDGELALKKIIYKYGPVTTLFRTPEKENTAATTAWKSLTHGSFNFACNPTDQVTHSMLIVGWTRTHWIIKNSYGNAEPWGINGYLYLNKRVAVSCAIMGPDSEIIFPSVV